MPGAYPTFRCAFTLIELVIVVVIIGIIGAIAIPRLSRGADGAAEAALVADLATLRRAIAHFAAEHGGRPPLQLAHLTVLTNANRAPAPMGQGKAEGYLFGPYLRKIPKLKDGQYAGADGVETISGADSDTNLGTDPTKAWHYNPDTGTIRANLPSTIENKTRIGEFLNRL